MISKLFIVEASLAAAKGKALLDHTMPLSLIAISLKFESGDRRMVADLLAQEQVLFVDQFECLAQYWIEWLLYSLRMERVTHYVENGCKSQAEARVAALTCPFQNFVVVHHFTLLLSRTHWFIELDRQGDLSEILLYEFTN